MSAAHCAGCNRTFSNPGYQRSHQSQIENPTCFAIHQVLLALEVGVTEELPPPSPQQPTSPMPGNSPRLTKTTPVLTDHEQMDLEGTPDNQ